MARTKTARTTTRSAVAALGALLAMSLTSCSGTPIAIRKLHPVRLSGRILATVEGSQPRVLEFRPSSNSWRSVALPATPLAAFYWGTPPVPYAFLGGDGGTNRLVRVEDDGSLRQVPMSSFAGVQSVGHPVGDRLLAGSCSGAQRVYVMDLRTGGAPREVARGCPAALSPDGGSVAYSPDLLSVWRIGLGGGSRAAPMFRLAGRLLLTLGMRQPRILPDVGMSWSRAGLAVAVQGDGRFACVLALTGGPVRVIPLGTARPTVLSWNPEGRLLAFTEQDRTGGAVRVYDAASGRLRLAALALGRELRGLVWSPRGVAMITLEGVDRWLIVTPGGHMVRSLAVPPGAMIWDWVA